MWGHARNGDTRGSRLGWALVLVFLLSAAACAQVEIGEDVKLALNGSVGVGYGGGWGSYGGSSHALSFNGTANLSGSYYSPQFLNFSLEPFYNRSQNNSASQSIFSSTGFIGSANLFSGSKFPGWISYSKTFDGSSEFGLPGVIGLETEGSSQSFAIGWSALVPKWPTLSASFSTSSNSSTVLGTIGEETETSSKSFNLSSTYTLAGFRLLGFFNHQTVSFTLPSFLGLPSDFSGTSTNGIGISATHSLPMSGSFGAGWGRTTYSNEGSGFGNGSTDNFNAGVTISPTRKLTVTGDIRYITNVIGALELSVLPGSGVPLLPVDNSSSSLAFGTTASYALGHGFALRGYASHRKQYYYGKDLSDTLYGGAINYNYSRPLFGVLHFSFGMVDTANQMGNSSLGFVGNIGLNRRFGQWDTSADFSYSQNVQTLLTLYTISSYTYGGNVRRRLGSNSYWSASARGAHSALTQREGEANKSYSFTTGLTWRKYGVTGGYSTSSGTTVLGVSGLLTPVPEVGLITNDLVLFNGRSYSVTVTMVPVRKMTVYATYANARSDTASNSVFSLNKTELINSRLEYRLRKLSVLAGFTRYRQGISSSGIPPSVVNSYSIGISRWFNVF